jgi:hypothetical protein
MNPRVNFKVLLIQNEAESHWLLLEICIFNLYAVPGVLMKSLTPRDTYASSLCYPVDYAERKGRCVGDRAEQF